MLPSEASQIFSTMFEQDCPHDVAQCKTRQFKHGEEYLTGTVWGVGLWYLVLMHTGVAVT